MLPRETSNPIGRMTLLAGAAVNTAPSMHALVHHLAIGRDSNHETLEPVGDGASGPESARGLSCLMSAAKRAARRCGIDVVPSEVARLGAHSPTLLLRFLT